MQKLIIKNTILRVAEILLILILIVSCQKSLPDVLTGGSYRYWLYIQGESSSPRDSSYNASRTTRKDSFQLYFDKTGLFMVYFGDYKCFDYYYIPKWEIKNDSIVNILNDQFLLEQYTNDKVLLKGKILKSGSVVVDTLEAIDINDVPKEYRKYRKLPDPPKGILIM